MELPSKSQSASKKKLTKDPDKGMEGTADDDQPIPCKRDARQKEHEHGRRPNVRAGAGSRTTCSASEVAKLAGDFGTHATENARHSLPLHIKSWSPGCSFPWA